MKRIIATAVLAVALTACNPTQIGRIERVVRHPAPSAPVIELNTGDCSTGQECEPVAPHVDVCSEGGHEADCSPPPTTTIPTPVCEGGYWRDAFTGEYIAEGGISPAPCSPTPPTTLPCTPGEGGKLCEAGH